MKQIRTLKDILVKFYSLLTQEQKKKSIILFIMMFFSAMFETLGVSSVIPFVTALISPEELKKNHIVSFMVKLCGIKNNNQIIILTATFIILVYFVKDLYLSVYAYYSNKYEKTLQKELSVKTYGCYLMRPYSYYLNTNSADILRGIETDIVNTTNLYTHINTLFSTGLSVILIAIYLIYTDWLLSLGIFVVGGACGIGLMQFFKKRLRGIGERNRAAEFETNKCAYQAINGIKEISVMKRMHIFIEKYNDAYENRRKEQIKFNFYNALPNRVIEFTCITGMMILICVKTILIPDGNNVMFVASLSAFVLGAFKILPSIGTMISEINSISYCRPFLNSCCRNVNELTKDQMAAGIKSIDVNEVIKSHFNTSVVIDGISWRYPGSSKYVLQDLSMIIKKGESIGVMGASGAGKTTLSDIILGLYHPQCGTITVDGTDIFSIPQSWAKLIGYVPQSVYLLDDTLKKNILFGLDESETTDEQIWNALEQAQLKSFVEGLPNKLDTMVGERGIKFSGGQRQRVAIARALYSHPEIMVLDEATSALDNGTESAVMDAIEHLHGTITLIIIAHRLTTISNCDRIFEIKDGKANLKDRAE